MILVLKQILFLSMFSTQFYILFTHRKINKINYYHEIRSRLNRTESNKYLSGETTERAKFSMHYL